MNYMFWILIISLNGEEIPATCNQSLCFKEHKDCFIFELRILTESPPGITAKCKQL